MTVLHKNKGKKGGRCNLTACQQPGAWYFNKSTRAYYCEDLAMSDTVRVKYSIMINKVGSDCEDVLEFDREDWDSMSEDERGEEMKQAAFEEVEWYWTELSEGGQDE